MTGLTFGDFTGGRVFELGTVTADRDEMLDYARRFDPQPVHLAERPTASGLFTASLWLRAWVSGVVNDTPALRTGGANSFSWPAPVHPGDALAARAGVLGARRSRDDPSLGVADILATLNRGDECVFRGQLTVLLRTEPT